MYYKDVLDILTHPLVEPYAQTSTLVNLINKTTLLYPSQISGESQSTDLFLLLFQKWEKGSLAVLRPSQLLMPIKDSLSNDNEEEKITKAFVFHFKVINKLINYYS
jgi:hypothetical protein